MSNTPQDHSHTREAIAERLRTPNHYSSLGDFVLGSIDGTITTFAIVAGVAGAELQSAVALVLGLANVLADGFSMAVGNYLKAASDQEVQQRFRRMEERHIERHPEGEREEIRQIFAAKGFEGELLEQVVDVIRSDREVWIDTMLAEEWGMPTTVANPKRAGIVTFFAFVLAGLIPLLPLVFSSHLGPRMTFVVSAVATGITFLLIGAVRGRITERSSWRTAFETLGMGGAAAALSYAVGALLRGLLGS